VVLVLQVDLADQACTGWNTLYLEHLVSSQDLLSVLESVLNGVLHVLGHVGGRKATEIRNFVVQGH